LLAGAPEKKVWLATLGTELRRVELESPEDTQRIRLLAGELAETKWCPTPGLEIIPYIAGTPAGTPRRADVLWLDQVLYVDQLPKAKLARRVPEEIGNAFDRGDMRAALSYSFERPSEDVRAYVEENFKLAPLSGSFGTGMDGGNVSPVEEAITPSPGPGGEVDQGAGIQGTGDVKPDGSTADAEDRDATVESDDEHDLTTSAERHLVRPHKPAKPSIFERFARSQGFRKESDERFLHEDGSWISRSKDTRSLWEKRTASGDPVRYYWPKDHCLERGPLQLEAEIWSLVDQHPDQYALVLSNHEGGPVEVSGTRVRTMLDRGEVALHPAAYRLVYNHDRHAP
jgi:hypothetical protein